MTRSSKACFVESQNLTRQGEQNRNGLAKLVRGFAFAANPMIQNAAVAGDIEGDSIKHDIHQMPTENPVEANQIQAASLATQIPNDMELTIKAIPPMVNDKSLLERRLIKTGAIANQEYVDASRKIRPMLAEVVFNMHGLKTIQNMAKGVTDKLDQTLGPISEQIDKLALLPNNRRQAAIENMKHFVDEIVAPTDEFLKKHTKPYLLDVAANHIKEAMQDIQEFSNFDQSGWNEQLVHTPLVQMPIIPVEATFTVEVAPEIVQQDEIAKEEPVEVVEMVDEVEDASVPHVQSVGVSVDIRAYKDADFDSKPYFVQKGQAVKFVTSPVGMVV